MLAVDELLLQLRYLLVQPPLRLPVRLPPLGALRGATLLLLVGLSADALALAFELALRFALTQLPLPRLVVLGR